MMRDVEAMNRTQASDDEPTWDEAVATFGSGRSVSLARPARKIIIRYRYEGGRCYATSPELTGFQVDGANLYETRNLAHKALRGWLDPGVELDEVMPFGHVLVARTTPRRADAPMVARRLRAWRTKAVNSLIVLLLHAAERIIDSMGISGTVQDKKRAYRSPAQPSREKTRL
jgi:hypothetical protein